MKRRIELNHYSLVFGIFISLFLIYSPVWAVYTWDGEGSYLDTVFSSDINWNLDGAPPAAINDSIVFGPSGYNVPRNDLGTMTGIQGISFTSSGFMIIGDPFSFESGATISGNSTSTQSFSAPLISNGPGGIVFDSDTFNVTLYSNISTGVAGGGLTFSGNRTYIIAGNNTYSGGTTISAGILELAGNNALGTGPLTISGGNCTMRAVWGPYRTIGNAISIEDTRTLTVSAGNELTLNGVISGAGSLVKSGSSILMLNGTNTYTGGTTVSGGSVIGNTDSLQGDITNNAAVVFDQAGSGTYSDTMSGTGTLTKQGTGDLTLDGTNTYTGGTTISGGTIVLGNNSALGTGTLTISGGNGAIRSNDDTRSVSNAISIDNTRALTVSGSSNLALTEVISGAGSLTKSGAGTLTLSGTNIYSGGTTLSTGTMILGNNSALGAGGLTLSGDCTLQSNDDNRLLANTIDLGMGSVLRLSGTNNMALEGEIFGGGTIIKSGSGSITLSGTNTYGGSVLLSDGAIVLGSNSALSSGSLLVTGNVAIQSNDDNRSLTNSITLYPGNALTVSGSSNLVIGGVISGTGSLITSMVEDADTLTLSRTNTYSGGTILNTGTIILGNNSALGSGELTLGGAGTLQSNNDIRLVSNTIVTGGNALTVSGASDLILGGAITGDGSLTKSGAGILTLGGNNTYSGGTTVSAGGLTGNTGSLQGNITNNAAVTFDQAGNGTYADIISGTGALTKTGAGILTLSGNNTYTGLTTLSAGMLNLSGQLFGNVVVDDGTFMGTGTIANSGNLTLNSGGTLAPGSSIGTTTVSGDYVQNAGSTLEIEVFKAANGTLSSDLLDVTGTAALEAGSTVNVTDLTPTDRFIGTGDVFTIITTGGGVTDNGAMVTSASASLSFAGSISGNDYLLTATRNAFGGSGLGSNNIALLQTVDADMGSAGEDYVTIINELSALGSAALNAAVERLSPLSHASTGSFNATLIQDMTFDMSGHLGARRHNTEHLAQFETLRHSDLLLADASGNPERLAYVIRETERRRQQQEETDREVNTFFRPFSVFLDQDSTTKFTGFQAQAVGAQFGMDRMFGSNWIFGLGGAYSHSFLDFDKGLGGGDIDSFRLGPYASYFIEDLYLDGSVSFGYHLNKTNREVEFGGIDRTAKADYDAYDLSASAGAGYELDLGRWTLTPTASVQYTCYRNESFEESGAGAAGLDVYSQTQQSLLSRFGVKLYTVAMLDTLKVAPELFVGYAHEFIDAEEIEASFMGGATKFVTDIDSNRDDSVYYGAGLSVLLKENVSAYVRYEGEYSSGSEINALNVGITMLF